MKWSGLSRPITFNDIGYCIKFVDATKMFPDGVQK